MVSHASMRGLYSVGFFISVLFFERGWDGVLGF